MIVAFAEVIGAIGIGFVAASAIGLWLLLRGATQ